MDPEALRAVAGQAIEGLLAAHDLQGRIDESTHFRPGRPLPTHRFLP
jgi:hypothetical protein